MDLTHWRLSLDVVQILPLSEARMCTPKVENLQYIF